MNYNYKFSIILVVNNNVTYLMDSIESIIDQSMNFEKNVQLIIVEDGNNDESLDIIDSYVNDFPNNIVVLSHDADSLASSRNLALDFTEGEFINFLNVGDYLSINALNEVYEFFKFNDDINIVSIAIENNKEGIQFNESHIIDLFVYPNNPILSLSSVFINRNLIDDLKFNTDLIYSEDSLFLNKLLLNEQKYALINSSRYYYKSQNLPSNIFNQLIYKKELYTERLLNFHLELINNSLKKNSYVPKFIQYTLLYDLLNIIKQPELDVFDDDFEKDEFFKILSEIFSHIDEDVINNNQFIDDSVLESFLFYIKYGDVNYELHPFNVELKFGEYVADNLNRHKFWLENVTSTNDHLNIAGFFNSFFDIDDISIVAVKEKNGKYNFYSGAYIKNSKRSSTKFLSKTMIYSHNFSLNIPTADLMDSNFRLRVDYHKNGNKLDNKRDNLIFSYLPIAFTYSSKWDDNFRFFGDDFLISLDDKYFNVKKGFKFSVVMAVYNTEEYVEEAIDSVINQTIGFEDNIQLILVNDGSTDGTEDILSEYRDKYPDNIILINQENQGQAAARNNGLKYAEGQYVNFLDSDDYFSENVMEEIHAFFKKHYSEIDLVSVPLVTFGRITDKHPLNYKFDKSKVIDLTKNPNNLQLHVSSSFIKLDVIGGLEFPTSITGSEDSNFVNKILLNKQKIGVIKEGVYFYRRREDESSTLDNMHLKEDYYTPRLKNHFMNLINFSISKYGKVPRFIQYAIIYDLQWILSVRDLDVYTKKSEKNEFWYYFNKILSYVDLDVIKRNENIKSKLKRSFLIYLKNKDLYVEIKNNNVLLKTHDFQLDSLNAHKIYLDILELKNGYLNISGFFNSLFNLSHLSVYGVKILDDGTESYYPGKYMEYTARKCVKFLDKQWQYPYNFDLKIPLTENKSQVNIILNYHLDGDINNNKNSNLLQFSLDLKFLPHNRISEVSNYFVKDNKLVYFEENSFKIIPYSYKTMMKFEKMVRKTIEEFKPSHFNSILMLRRIYSVLYPFMRNKKIYLFMDRIDVADDNGEHLFKYAVSRKDNIKKYFVLSRDSKDYSRISKIGKVIKYGSFKHKLLYLFADKVISSHPDERILNPFFSFDGKDDKRKYLNSLVTSGIYFLQHGVKKDDFSDWLKKYDKNLNLLLTVSDLEKKSFMEEGYNYDDDVVQVLGLPRHDNLKNNPNNKILLIPTWRNYLEGNRFLFKNSDFFKSINDFINDERLKLLCEKYGYEVIFKAHPKLNSQISDDDADTYVDLFEFNDYVKVSTEETYQELFEKGSVLITDYSSVFFDFAYLKKPIIYYQPNDDNHHEKSYFIFETMGFGDVIKDLDNLISKLEYYMNDGCNMEQKYKDNVDGFFKYLDKNNCQRVYDWIIKN